MAHNYPKWPKNDARIYTLFPQFFLTEKEVPQTFSLLECMTLTRERLDSMLNVKSVSHLIQLFLKKTFRFKFDQYYIRTLVESWGLTWI